MVINKFYSSDFRNIENCEITFSPGVNFLLGNNAEGKTNALEGIYFFARGKSFRHADEKELVRYGKDGFRLKIEYSDKRGENTLEYSVLGREKRRKKNGYNLKSVSEMIGSFRAVLFFPDDLMMVKGGPDLRREFLNVSISQCYPEYINLYRLFKNAIENRNALLKNASKGFFYDEGELLSWSEIIADYSADIYLYRKEYIKKLELYSSSVIEEISCGKDKISLFYKNGLQEEYEDEKDKEVLKKAFINVFNKSLDREKAAGTTLYGPTREDILINICGMDSRVFSSQGQQRSIVLALKLAEGEIIRELFGEYPVYLFDDVLSELDNSRQEYVLKERDKKQIIITGTGDNRFIRPDKIISVSGGKYS